MFDNRYDVARKTVLWLKIFCLLNFSFDVAFVVGSLYLFTKHVYYIALIAALAFFAIQYLFFYVKEVVDRTTNEMNPTWYIQHFNTLVYYCVLKSMLIVVFVFMAIVDTANIDIMHTLMYLADGAIFCVAVMALTFFAMTIVAIYVMPKHRQIVYDIVDAEDQFVARLRGTSTTK